VPVWLASGTGYAIGTLQSFVLSRHWTFAADDHAHPLWQALIFAAVNIVCMLCFSYAVVQFDRWLALTWATLAATILVLPLSFTLYRLLVFRKPKLGTA
jgi:putative flippase GtrA